MSISRTPTFWALLLAIALSFAAVGTATPAPTPAPTDDSCGAIVIRSILNDGYVSPHRNCTEADHRRVQEAINAAFAATIPTRQLRTVAGRKTGHSNCASLCEGSLTRASCYVYDSSHGLNCDSWAYVNCPATGVCRRRAQEKKSSYVVIDDIFNNEPIRGGGDYVGHRQLTPTVITGCVTEEECNEYKARLTTAALSALGDIASECANLLLSQNLLQCLMVAVDHD